MRRLLGWFRRRNLSEAHAYAKQADLKVGTVHAFTDARGVSAIRRVPDRVYGYALRLRLWAADVAKGLRA